MKKILAFGASTSSQSINQQLARYAVNQLSDVEVDFLDLNDFEMPIFNVDRENESGIPQEAHDFKNHVREVDGILISFAEHNGSYTAAYKNLFDWTSRINAKVFQNKPMILLATSPGPGGASSVLATAITSAPFFDGVVKASLSVPNFYENFDVEQGRIISDEINTQLITTVNSLFENATPGMMQVV